MLDTNFLAGPFISLHLTISFTFFLLHSVLDGKTLGGKWCGSIVPVLAAGPLF